MLKSIFLWTAVFMSPVITAFCDGYGGSIIPEDTWDKWTLSGGTGLYLKDKRVFSVTGDGKDTNKWVSPKMPLKAGTTYLLEHKAKGENYRGGGGLANAGTNFVSRDISPIQEAWTSVELAFQTPLSLSDENSTLKVGQWHKNGTVLFSSIKCIEAVPVYESSGDMELGDGEEIYGSTYRYTPVFTMAQYRPLEDFNCYFNTNRWVFSSGSFLFYRHKVTGIEFRSAEVGVSICYYIKGNLNVELSNDGKNFRKIGQFNKMGSHRVKVPEDMFPASCIWVRLSLEQGELQVNSYSYEAEITKKHEQRLSGKTTYLKKLKSDDSLKILSMKMDEIIPGRTGAFKIELESSSLPDTAIPCSASFRADEKLLEFKGLCDMKSGKGAVSIQCQIPISDSISDIVIKAGDKTEMLLPVNIPAIRSASYGELLPGSNESVTLWSASSGWKVGRTRPLPVNKTPELKIQAASNEAEATQLIITPSKNMKNIALTCSAMRCGAASLQPDSVEIRQLAYVPVSMPTDRSGGTGEWPDPIIPIQSNTELKAGVNHPFWIRVSVPENTRAGIYSGTIKITADSFSAEVPFKVEVFAFSLPSKSTCVATMGMGNGSGLDNMFRYFNITKIEDKRVLNDRYLKLFAANRITPFNPAPFDSPAIEWVHGKEIPTDKWGCKINWEKYDRELSRVMDKYHFNSFSIKIPGLVNGGLGQIRLPELCGYKHGSPEFTRLFNSCASEYDKFIKAKGWQKNAYVYVYDEPTRKVFPALKTDLDNFKLAAPDIRRLVTVDINDALAGSVDIWSIPAHTLMADDLKKRLEAGDDVWWYVCTSTKAPYCGNFIDHAGIELRTWLWQTWKYGVTGVLLWDSVYWKTKLAPNPYLDPMSWSYSGSPWGNGDGRMIYPPLSALDNPSKKKIFDDPVPSVRLEMVRDGIEDYEYFAILRDLIKAKSTVLTSAERKGFSDLLTVPDEVSKSMTEFSINPAHIMKHREKLARAIEKLSNIK
jgi:hypothetical protein